MSGLKKLHSGFDLESSMLDEGGAMKHFVLLLIAGLALYGVWQMTSPLLRRYAGPAMTRHLLRLLVFVLVLLGLLLLAYYFPPIHLL